MALYCGIDLHSNNSYVAVLDDDDRVVGRWSRAERPGRGAASAGAVTQAELRGVVVE